MLLSEKRLLRLESQEVSHEARLCWTVFSLWYQAVRHSCSHSSFFQGITIAPLWDFCKGQFIGLLSAMDFILIMREVWPVILVSPLNCISCSVKSLQGLKEISLLELLYHFSASIRVYANLVAKEVGEAPVDKKSLHTYVHI